MEIVHYPTEVLTRQAEPVLDASKVSRSLLAEMVDMMYEAEGVGLAAPQVGIPKQIIIMSPKAKRGQERILFNPVILESKGGDILTEGCLSLPGISAEVRRPTQVTFKAMTTDGEQITETLKGFPARVIQHEIDHLNGKLIIDHLDFDMRQRLLSQYEADW